MGDTVVSLLFGNKGLPLFKIAAELAGKSRYKMADLLLWNKGLVFKQLRKVAMSCGGPVFVQ